MRYPLQRTMLVLGSCLIVGPVMAQDRSVVPPPILTTDYQKPAMLPTIPTSSGGGAVSSEPAPGAGAHNGGGAHGGIKDVTPPFIPGGNGHSNGHGSMMHETAPQSHWSHSPDMGPAGWYGFGEALIMKPRRSASDYGIADANNDIVPRGKSDSVLYDISLGVRVGIGYNTGNGWSVGLAYTNLRNSDQRSLAVGPNGVIYPTLTRPGLIDVVSTANADVSLEYDVFDFEFRKKVMLDESFAMKWGGGVKMASIRQELSSFYNGRDANIARVLNINDFYGTGPSFGGETHWMTMGGLSVYSKGSAALLVGDMKTGLTETNNRGNTVNADIQDKFARVVPVVSAGVGLNYQFRNVKASVGYEVTNYFGLIQRTQFVDDFAEGKITTRSGDLSLDGFTFRLGWDY